MHNLKTIYAAIWVDSAFGPLTLRHDTKEELEKDFLQSILEDYRIMYDKEIEYRQSNESVDENILCNEYTFTADGKRFG